MGTNGGETQSISLGKSIQNARKRAGLTQQDLCHNAKISYSTLAKIERGAIASPSVFTVHAIAHSLGTSVDTLLAGAGIDVHGNNASGSGVGRTLRTSQSGVKFVYFDVNGVLVQFYHAAFSALAQETNTALHTIESTFWHYNDDVCSGRIAVDEFNGLLAKTCGVDSLDWRDYYDAAIQPITESIELITWVADNYKVGLLTNIMPGQLERMTAAGVLPKLNYDVIIDSSQAGMIKPDPTIFDVATQKAGVQSQEILFIDDSRSNVMAAEHQGLQVSWFNTHTPAESVNRIKSALET